MAEQHFAYSLMEYTVELNKPLYKTILRNLFVTKDKLAHKLVLRLTRNGKDIAYTGKVNATLITYADNMTQTATGTVEDGKPTLVFPAEFYAKSGMFCLLLSVGDASTTNTVFAGEGCMILGETDSYYDPSGVVPSLPELLAQLDAARSATTAANTAAGVATSASEAANDAAGAANTAASAANAAAKRAEDAALGYEQGNSANADKLGYLSPGFYGAQENLLDNPYWLHEPVNQQGASEYSGAGRAYDRWQGMSRSKMRWSSEDPRRGMYLSNTAPDAGGAFVQQVIPEERIQQALATPSAGFDFRGTLTVAISTMLGTFVASGELGDSIEAVAGANNVEHVKATFLTNAEGKRIFRLSVPQGSTGEKLVYWVGLFPGIVDASAIPKLHTRTQGEELARCQWFYRRHRAVTTYGTLGTGVARTGTTAWLLINRRRMRTDSPAVTIGGTLNLQHGNGSAIAATAVNVDKVSDDWIRLNVTVASGLTAGMPVVALSGATANVYVDEDCDLV